MADSTKSSNLSAIQPFLEFFVGIFGAFAIIGVFFKIQQYPNSEFFMIVGFMGEAAAFVIMGSFALISYFTGGRSAGAAPAETTTAVVAEGRPPEQAGRATARKMMEEQVSDDLNTMMGGLAKEVEHFEEQVREMNDEMERTRSTFSQMRDVLGSAADGRLAEDAQRLGEGMSHLGGEMQGASDAVERLHADLDEMVTRFRQFNRPASGGPESDGAPANGVHAGASRKSQPSAS